MKTARIQERAKRSREKAGRAKNYPTRPTRKKKGAEKPAPGSELAKAQKWIDSILKRGKWTDSDHFPRPGLT